MNSSKKCIVIVDRNIKFDSDLFENMNDSEDCSSILDPVILFSQFDWSCYDDDAKVINMIYSLLVEEAVMNDKKLICFLPLAQPSRQDWFELTSSLKSNSCELELYNFE